MLRGLKLKIITKCSTVNSNLSISSPYYTPNVKQKYRKCFRHKIKNTENVLMFYNSIKIRCGTAVQQKRCSVADPGGRGGAGLSYPQVKAPLEAVLTVK